MNYVISITKLLKYLKQIFHLSFVPIFLAVKFSMPGAFAGMVYMAFAWYMYVYVKKVDINDEPVMVFSAMITIFLYSGL